MPGLEFCPISHSLGRLGYQVVVWKSGTLLILFTTWLAGEKWNEYEVQELRTESRYTNTCLFGGLHGTCRKYSGTNDCQLIGSNPSRY